MRFVCTVFPYDRWGGVDPLVDAVRLAESLGYDSVALPEHVVMPLRPDVPAVSVTWYDNIVLAAHLAARTTRIRIIFHALVVPYRPPVQTAKQIATLDTVSGGRVTVVAGSGWMRREFAALGVPFDERGDITDEYLRAMRELWTSPSPRFSGPRVSFSDIAFVPRCVQVPHVPVWIGGAGVRPLRRVVELGDGWAPMRGDLGTIAGTVRRLRDQLAAAGRDPSRLDVLHTVQAGPPDAAAATAAAHASGAATPHGVGDPERSADELRDEVGRCAEAGVTHLSVSYSWQTPAEYAERLRRFADQVIRGGG